jgi:YHS domain-containing protein
MRESRLPLFYRSWLIVAAAFAALPAAGQPPPASAQALPGTAASRHEGIWKAAVPPRPMRAEFDGLDPLGLAAGAKIKADCSLNWIDPNDGKRYCFSSGTSLEFFLDEPQAHIDRARAAWRKLTDR